MTKEHAAALLLLAGVEARSFFQLENPYWPNTPDYEELRRQSPWWLVTTPYGAIRMGWRKRVLHIDWKDTVVRGIITEDSTTKDDTMVHAWTYDAAVRYLAAWKKRATK